MFCQVEITGSAVPALVQGGNDAAALAILANSRANDTLFLSGNEAVRMNDGIGLAGEHEIKRAGTPM